ncbi:MAG: 4Fe-4S binding protein [Adhaeribacter sp.]
MASHHESLAIGYAWQDKKDFWQQAGLTGFGAGLLALVLAWAWPQAGTGVFWSGMALAAGGLGLYFLRTYLKSPPGVKNNGVWLRDSTSRGAIAWITAVFLTGFYILLYWFPASLQGLIRSTDGFSDWLRGKPADHWFVYGLFYTGAVLVMGGRAILKYRHSPYQLIRTCSVMFFQLGFAFLLPYFLVNLNRPEFYFSYFWPLKYDYLFPGTVWQLRHEAGALGIFMVFWTSIISFIGVPLLTYFFGKRWYCSWVCGCGGLAETAGDPYRHLSDKSRKAWRYEVAIIYPILGLIVLVTALLWINSFAGGALLGSLSNTLAQGYGFFIGAIFSGVIGVGFYPLMGSRVWCRFGCPMAAYIGWWQKHFSRFRITTNGGQCISCGNCSTYCEMGIDVRWYAQQGQPIIRASCVGCGICATVCPRGVLNLENGPRQNRYQGSALISPENLRILS